MKMPAASGLVWTALTASLVVYLYHKGNLPGMKGAKKTAPEAKAGE